MPKRGCALTRTRWFSLHLALVATLLIVFPATAAKFKAGDYKTREYYLAQVEKKEQLIRDKHIPPEEVRFAYPLMWEAASQDGNVGLYIYVKLEPGESFNLRPDQVTLVLDCREYDSDPLVEERITPSELFLPKDYPAHEYWRSSDVMFVKRGLPLDATRDPEYQEYRRAQGKEPCIRLMARVPERYTGCRARVEVSLEASPSSARADIPVSHLPARRADAGPGGQ